MNNLVSRGFRNHNPLNIRRSDDKWLNQSDRQTDPQFVQFKTDVDGYRAAFITLKTYFTKYGCDTIRKIISRWAPPTENNTRAYIREVSSISLIDPDEQLRLTDCASMVALVCAMAMVENGVDEVNVADVNAAYRLAFG